MRSRNWLLASLALTTLTSACVFDFATVTLFVHESANPAFRRASEGNNMRVSYVLDELRPDGTSERVVDGFSFASDGALDSPKQRLKPNPQVLTMALAVGSGTGFALADSRAVGRVDPLSVPSLDDGPVALEAFAFLAQPDFIEQLDDAVPAGLVQAVCDNRAGFVHSVGSVAAYNFDLDDLALVSNAGFATEAAANIACDVADLPPETPLREAEGKVVVAHGVCDDGSGTHTVVLDLGGDEELTLNDQPGELCDPFVRVVTFEDGSSRVWIATRTFASLYALNMDDAEDGTLLGRQEYNPDLTGPVRHVLLDDGALLVGGLLLDEDGKQIGSIVRRSSADDALQPAVPTTLDLMIAGDPSGPSALFAEANATFTLRRPTVNNDVVGDDGENRPVRFAAGFVPTRILVLHGDDDDRANDVVVGMNDAGDVQIEGGELHTGTQRNGFAVAFGRAIILAGNLPGHDVLVRPFDDAELALLEQRTSK